MSNRDDAAGAARHHYLRTHLVRAAARGETPTLVWARTGAPHPELNRVLWFTPSEVARSGELMEGVPALWTLWPGTEGFGDTAAAASEHGLVPVEEEPLMALALASSAIENGAAFDLTSNSSTQDVRIEACRSLDDLERWARFWGAEDLDARQLSTLPATLAPVADLGQPEPAGAVTHYLALHDDTVVGCSAAVVAGASAAVEHVIVDAGWRHRGIGSLLTVAAIRRATASGCTTCVLTASPDGENLYRRLGFTEVCRVRSFGRA